LGELGFQGIRFAAVGHVTNDRLPQGLYPGGSALYAALAAASMGASARIVTSFGRDFIGSDLLRSAGIHLDASASDQTTTFEAVDSGGARTWRVLCKASSIATPVEQADIVFVCPVLAEVEPVCLRASPGTIVAAGLQGWLRVLGTDGLVEPREPKDLSFLRGCTALFCSDEDLAGNAARVLPVLLGLAKIVVVTEGLRGAVLYLDGHPHRVHAFPTLAAVDPTGAGDTFATCFILALASGQGPLEAAVLGACGASVTIEGPGAAAVGRLAALDERVAWYRSHLPAPAPIEPDR